MIVTVKQNKTATVVAKLTSAGKIQTESPVTLKNTIQNQISMGEIVDVVEGTPVDGSSLVYNALIDKYEVKPITIGLPAAVDGGEF